VDKHQGLNVICLISHQPEARGLFLLDTFFFIFYLLVYAIKVADTVVHLVFVGYGLRRVMGLQQVAAVLIMSDSN